MSCYRVTIAVDGDTDGEPLDFDSLADARAYAREYRDFHVAEGCTSRGALATDGGYVIQDADRCGAHGPTVTTVVTVARVDGD